MRSESASPRPEVHGRHTPKFKWVGSIVPLVACVGIALPSPLLGQASGTGTLSGQVLDEGTGEPVEGVRIVLEGLKREGISNGLGRFVLSELPPGLVQVGGERIGYARSHGAVEIRAGEVTEALMYMSTEAVPLEGVVVTARRREVSLPPVRGLERRYFSGWGRFVLEDEIRKRNPTKLVEVLRETGLEVTGNGTSVMLSRANCAPAVYLDGVKVTHPLLIKERTGSTYQHQWPDPSASPAQETAYNLGLVHPSSVLAVEVYRSAMETPAEFLDLDSNCGAVVVWTRRGAGLPEADRLKGRPGWERALMAATLGAVAWFVGSIF